MQIRPRSGVSPLARAMGLTAIAVIVAACGTGPPASVAGASGSGRSPVGSVAGATGGPSTRTAHPSAVASAGASVAPSIVRVPTGKPVASVKGTGFTDSKAFKLKAGDFVVQWTVTSASTKGCGVIGGIHSPDGQVSVEVANTSMPGKGSKAGQRAVPQLSAGTYVVTFATTCSWTAKVYQQ